MYKATIRLAATAAAALLPVMVLAAWPHDKPLTWVVPFPPGGNNDVLSRAVAQQVAISMRATIVVENRAGAGGLIGAGFVAHAAPDGYTLLGSSIGPQSIAPHLISKPAYDNIKAFAPVITMGVIPHVLVTGPTQPYSTLGELVNGSKASDKGLTYASGGNGTILRMQGELLKDDTGGNFVHVPYKGDAPALQDVLAQHADFMFAPVSVALPLLQTGKLKALAATSEKRLGQLPNVPTMKEAGVKAPFVVEQWQGVFVPAGTPASVISTLNAEIGKALRSNEVVSLAEKLGVTLSGGTPQELGTRHRSDSQKWGAFIKAHGIVSD